MSLRLERYVFAAVLLASVRAFACGPDFPLDFLFERDKTLATLPDGLFALEASRLVAAPAQRFVVGEEPKAWRDRGGAQERALYAAGAELWHSGQRELAAKKWQAILSLPAPRRRTFTVAAQYNLARDQAPEAAKRSFAQLRADAEAGFDDAAGLAVASLGDEAKLALDAGDDAQAVALYALQAAHGGGTASLLFVVRALASDEARLKRALPDPLVQRLIATYLWTRSTEDWWSTNKASSAVKVLDSLVALPKVAGGDRLAAALFRAGRFEEAQRSVANEDSAIAHWTKAKLFERSGQRDEADHELNRAAQGYALGERWSEAYSVQFYPRQQLQLERAILALQRNDFDSAMQLAIASCSWEDVAYLGERVIDVSSLRRVVDAPGSDACAVVSDPNAADDSRMWPPPNQRVALRSVLARRLLREGHGVEALPYFDAATRPFAQRYEEALLAAHAAADPLDRAARLYEAARIVRTEGIDLLGFEGEPDYRVVGGYYELHEKLPTTLVNADERARCAASAPKYPQRFHHREVASHLAEDAAAQVAPRSQAFVALLCKAAAYVNHHDDARVTALYQRTIKEGALLSEPMIFAERCPEPKFVPARAVKKHWPHVRKRWIGLALLGVLGALVIRRVKQRRSARS